MVMIFLEAIEKINLKKETVLHFIARKIQTSKVNFLSFHSETMVLTIFA
jgi:hypothetical protein